MALSVSSNLNNNPVPSMVEENQDQQDDGNWHAYQPEKNSAAHVIRLRKGYKI